MERSYRRSPLMVSATLSLNSACLWLFKARSDVCLSIKAAAEHKAHPKTMNYRDGKSIIKNSLIKFTKKKQKKKKQSNAET